MGRQPAGRKMITVWANIVGYSLIIGVVAYLLGLTWFTGQVIWIKQMLRHKRWRETDGKVVRCWIESHEGGVQPEIRFAFVVEGKQYLSDGFWRLRGPNWGEESARSLLTPYGEGIKVRVHYDPSYAGSAFVRYCAEFDSDILPGFWMLAAACPVLGWLASWVLGLPAADLGTEEKALLLVGSSIPALPTLFLGLFIGLALLWESLSAGRHWTRAQASVVVMPVLSGAPQPVVGNDGATLEGETLPSGNAIPPSQTGGEGGLGAGGWRKVGEP